MKLSEELIYRGFKAENTIENPEDLDTRENKTFYWGADPSADSLTIGNLAALMMCACFVRHGWKPYLLVGGATGQIGDPKENGERELKTLDEVEHNKKCIREQVERVINSAGYLTEDLVSGDVNNQPIDPADVTASGRNLPGEENLPGFSGARRIPGARSAGARGIPENIPGKIRGNISNHLDHSFIASRAHESSVRPAPQSQTDSFDNDGFTGAGFAGDDVETIMKVDFRVFDDSKIPDADMSDHNILV